MSKFGWIEKLFANLGYAERGRRLAQAAASNPGLERAIRAAVASGDRRQLLELFGQNVRATDPPPVRAQPAPRIVEGRPRTDDQIVQDGVREELGPVADAPMPFVRRAHEELIKDGGGEELVARLNEQAPRPLYSLDIANDTTPVSQATGGWGGWQGTVDDVFPGAPTRSFEVPFEPGRELAPLGPRGMTTPSPRGLVPQGPRDLAPQSRDLSVPERAVDESPIRLEGPRQPRIEGPAQRRIEGPQQPRIEAPGVAAERNAMDDLARAVDADAARRRVPPDGDFRFEPGQRRAGGGGTSTPAGGKGGSNWKKAAGGIAATAAGAGAIKLGLDAMWPLIGDREGGPTTADLAAEQNPPPEVPTREPEPIRPAGRPAVAPSRPQPPASTQLALSPREQAHQMIKDLNERRRRAGGEVPEAPQMMREINRLLSQSNQAAAAVSRGEQAEAVGGDYHAQARQLLARLNDMRRQAGGEVPQARQIMAEVSRLQRLGDEQRNAGTTAFPRR